MTGKEKDIMPGRRQFLLRAGLLGAAVTVSPCLLYSNPAVAIHTGMSWTLDNLRRALEALTTDTLAGAVAFVVPGVDEHSQVQGVTTAEPGGLATRADLFLAGGLDLGIPLPAPSVLNLVNAYCSELEKTPLSIPLSFTTTLGVVEHWLLEHLDNQLDEYLATEGMKGSTLISLLLNLLATRLNPFTVIGPLLAPFSRLSWQQKAQVLKQLEEPSPVLVSTIQAYLTEPLRSALPSLLQSVGASIMQLSSFGSYTEWAVFDPATRQLTARPLGWSLSGFQPNGPPPVEGWNEFKGYYQNRRSV